MSRRPSKKKKPPKKKSPADEFFGAYLGRDAWLEGGKCTVVAGGKRNLKKLKKWSTLKVKMLDSGEILTVALQDITFTKPPIRDSVSESDSDSESSSSDYSESSSDADSDSE